MKLTTLVLILSGIAGGVPAKAQIAATNGPVTDLEALKGQLFQKYDANHNGKIDIEERKNYVRELAAAWKSSARDRAAEFRSRKAANPEAMHLPLGDPASLLRYDVN